MSRSPRSQPYPWRVHPIWRGIGCIFLIIVPLIAIGLTDTVLSLVEMPTFGIWGQSLTLPLVGEVEFFLARALVALALMVALFLIFSILGSFLYSRMGGLGDEDIASFTKRSPYDRR